VIAAASLPAISVITPLAIFGQKEPSDKSFVGLIAKVLLLISMLLITTVSTLPPAFQISTLMDVAGNLATVDQTLVIDTVAPSFTTQANTELNNKSDLIINFNENIKTQGGSVEIWNASGNVETVVISNSDINNNTLTINPTNDLSEGSFYLKMASGVITDMAGNDAAAITKDSMIN
jgi:methionine-rich copper-binding protein CopC